MGTRLYVPFVCLKYIHDGGPVVGEVLGERAGRTSALVANVASHVGMEGVSTNDLVNVGRRRPARLHEMIKPLNSQGRASESEGGLRRNSECCRKSERGPLHLCELKVSREGCKTPDFICTLLESPLLQEYRRLKLGFTRREATGHRLAQGVNIEHITIIEGKKNNSLPHVPLPFSPVSHPIVMCGHSSGISCQSWTSSLHWVLRGMRIKLRHRKSRI
jgi:hypothetical protein